MFALFCVTTGTSALSQLSNIGARVSIDVFRKKCPKPCQEKNVALATYFTLNNYKKKIIFRINNNPIPQSLPVPVDHKKLQSQPRSPA